MLDTQAKIDLGGLLVKIDSAIATAQNARRLAEENDEPDAILTMIDGLIADLEQMADELRAIAKWLVRQDQA